MDIYGRLETVFQADGAGSVLPLPSPPSFINFPYALAAWVYLFVFTVVRHLLFPVRLVYLTCLVVWHDLAGSPTARRPLVLPEPPRCTSLF